MAREILDQTENEPASTFIGRLNRMFTELYASFGGATDPSIATLTTSGAATIGGLLTAAAGLALTGAATISGLATAGSLKLDTGTKTASATGGAATLAKMSGIITSEALTTAAGALYTLTITNSTVAAADIAFASVQNGTNTQGTPHIVSVTPGSSSLVIVVRNAHASEALNGTLKIAFAVLKA